MIYFLDANVLLRFLLKDSIPQAEIAKSYFEKAYTGKLQLVILPEIILEVEYVLRKVYHHSKLHIIEDLLTVITNPNLDVRNRSILHSSLELYKKTAIDIIDAILFYSSQLENARILSFDKDFDKLKELSKI